MLTPPPTTTLRGTANGPRASYETTIIEPSAIIEKGTHG